MENLKKTVRLKKSESIDLQEKAFSLTKKAIYQGNKVLYQEADLVHFMIDETLNNIDIDENGKLILKK